MALQRRPYVSGGRFQWSCVSILLLGVAVAVFVGRADNRDDDRVARTQWSGRTSAAPVRPPRMTGISDRYRTDTSRATQEEFGRDA